MVGGIVAVGSGVAVSVAVGIIVAVAVAVSVGVSVGSTGMVAVEVGRTGRGVDWTNAAWVGMMVGTTDAALVEVGRGGRAVAITCAVAVDVGRDSRPLVCCGPALAPWMTGAASDPLDIIGISRSTTISIRPLIRRRGRGVGRGLVSR